MTDIPSSPSAAAAAPDAGGGRVLSGRYRLVRKLASGGMAEVWEATDEVLARQVAVKVLHTHLAADESFVERFRREAVAAARLAHPAIVSIFDTCADDHCEAIVMELVRGRTLRDHLDEHGALSPAKAIQVVAEAADALDFAHQAGVVHRDVKPGNIMLSDDGRVLVTDFGIAKAASVGSDLTREGTVIGTAKYLAPEQVEGGHVDGRADVYALGVVLYELLCGRVPFEADNDLATAVMRLSAEPLRPRHVKAGIPRRLEEIVLKAMARDPDERYASASELRAALRDVDVADDATSSVVAQTRDPTPAGGTPGPSFAQTERTWLVPATIVCLVAVGLGVAGVLLGRTEVGRDLFQNAKNAVGAEPSTPEAAEALAFDPEGGDGENNDLAKLVIDGNDETVWRTERYNERSMAGKEGVGIWVRLASSARVGKVTVTSPTADWTASIHVTEQPALALDGWGPPVAERSGIEPGETTFDTGRRTGTGVLLWITDVGGDRSRVEIGEIRVEG